MAARYVGVVRPGRPPYTLRRPKNLRRMVREREFSLSLNVRHRGTSTATSPGAIGQEERENLIVEVTLL